ncbi:DUF3828 domain-containing protein [Kaistia geumhonensis]|uniref:DUF3828 domain-containing protein n=1 Tax=Kaistia geumhonensis TaxID=410839 RepID=A0ABU0M9K2_9HYPH|nr:DUF3828 domain-containing protein [Kaistia geumhonensis]MCX5480643.1 DUF3828 domain-containing protein [Kaistia geumhonensis]MDQ0517654.1 hypothetical protein [Kaistia geumhonensis]
MAFAPTFSRRGLLAASAALALAASSAGLARAAAAPEAFLEAIYGAYRGEGDGVDLGDRAALDSYFTPDLAGMIADDRARAEAADDVPLLDGDPFIDAQDWEIENLAVTVEHGADGKATGHVRFVNAGTPVAVDVMLVETPAGWRIRDIHWPNGSLRGLYTH